MEIVVRLHKIGIEVERADGDQSGVVELVINNLKAAADFEGFDLAL